LILVAEKEKDKTKQNNFFLLQTKKKKKESPQSDLVKGFFCNSSEIQMPIINSAKPFHENTKLVLTTRKKSGVGIHR
jgi:hypothetical protein